MVTEAGRMRYRKTAFNLAPATFLKDVNRLDLDPYDLIACDYEPVTAWAAKAKGREVIGIGHQYAFGKNTPLSGDNAVSRLVMNQFASVDIPVGLHWAPFDNTILPPILDLPDINPDATRDHVLVYLPSKIKTPPLDGCRGSLTNPSSNIHRQFVMSSRAMCCGKRPTSTDSNVTSRQQGVICNTGFELISECLQWGKPVLTRPLAKQMEQLSNAAALEQLGYATTMQALDTQRRVRG